MMERDTHKYTVEVFGEHYQLVSDETHEHLAQVSARVDTLMRDIARKMDSAEVKKVAVLAALQLASALVYFEREKDKRARESQELRARIDEALSAPTSQQP